MTSVPPPTLFSHLRTLFGVGTLSGLGKGELLERLFSHRDETAFEGTIETPAIRTPALTFTPDGSKLVCGMADTSVLAWDVAASP